MLTTLGGAFMAGWGRSPLDLWDPLSPRLARAHPRAPSTRGSLVEGADEDGAPLLSLF